MKALEEYLSKNPKTNLIFDFDETIAMLILPWHKWFEEVADQIKKIDPEIHESSYPEVHNAFVAKHGDEGLWTSRELNEEFELRNLAGLKANPEVVDLIKNNKKYVMFVWSSNSEIIIVNALKKLGIENHFKKIVSRSNARFAKPHPQGFELIDDGTPRKDYLFIGDSFSDSGAAKKLGIDFFKIDYFKSLT